MNVVIDLLNKVAYIHIGREKYIPVNLEEKIIFLVVVH
jgi:hypothetical protein